MHIRCAACSSSVWADPGSTDAVVSCSICRHEHEVGSFSRIGDSGDERHVRVREFAIEHGLDFPGATSVLLGLIELEDACKAQGSSARHAADAARNKRDAAARHYDRGFRDAVARGDLSVHQAIAKGNRERFITGLMERHRFPRKLAEDATDGKISVGEAIRKQESMRKVTARPASTRPSFGALRLPILLMLVLVSVTVFLASNWSEPAEQTSPTPPPASPEIARDPAIPVGNTGPPAVVQANEAGRPVKIVGHDPRAVLLAYCEMSPDARWMTPQEITSAVPPNPRARFGIYLEGRSGTRRAILIRRNQQNQRWIAGTGDGIVDSPAPELPPGGFRTALNAP